MKLDKLLMTVMILVIILSPLFIGMVVDFSGGGALGGLPAMINISVVYAIAITLLGGIYAISYFVKKIGPKGFIVVTLIVLILIPLAFLGSCGLLVMGGSVKDLFLK